jgi:hypothetical protein
VWPCQNMRGRLLGDPFRFQGRGELARPERSTRSALGMQVDGILHELGRWELPGSLPWWQHLRCCIRRIAVPLGLQSGTAWKNSGTLITNSCACGLPPACGKCRMYLRSLITAPREVSSTLKSVAIAKKASSWSVVPDHHLEGLTNNRLPAHM